jgi:hypothetical protein
MDLRTTISIPASEKKITYSGKVMFTGSCFATSIGKQFETGHLPVMINPSGTVYNPVSVINTLDTITGRRLYREEDLYNNNGTWISFNHYTDFSSDDPSELLARINKRAEEAGKFISESNFLFVTFGTARVYRWKKTNAIVSNCHKIRASGFDHELLTVKNIVTLWNSGLDKLQRINPDLKVVFTISPVRHWKDGAHGNQVSKSVLFLAVEELLQHPSKPGYFPAYELLMDDLRDYRFYEDDMLHPSGFAVEYIWEAFSQCYFDDTTRQLWKEIAAISKAISHKIKSDSASAITTFAGKLSEKIDYINSRFPQIDLSKEKAYFLKLLQK